MKVVHDTSPLVSVLHNFFFIRILLPEIQCRQQNQYHLGPLQDASCYAEGRI